MKTFAHNPFVRIAHKSLAYILVFSIVNMPVWALNGGMTEQDAFQSNVPNHGLKSSPDGGWIIGNSLTR